MAGCERNRPLEIQTKDIAVGVIETKGKEKSRIQFYDSDMNELGLGALSLDFTTVGNIFYIPLIDQI